VYLISRLLVSFLFLIFNSCEDEQENSSTTNDEVSIVGVYNVLEQNHYDNSNCTGNFTDYLEILRDEYGQSITKTLEFDEVNYISTESGSLTDDELCSSVMGTLDNGLCYSYKEDGTIDETWILEEICLYDLDGEYSDGLCSFSYSMSMPYSIDGNKVIIKLGPPDNLIDIEYGTWELDNETLTFSIVSDANANSCIVIIGNKQ
jgi:hypothetical protein